MWHLRCGVYPHGRGGALSIRKQNSLIHGLSPRAWGSPSEVARIVTSLGVYPHGRGGARRGPSWSGRLSGLSPRAWGSHSMDMWCPCSRRSIPTGVGEPCNNPDIPYISTVYPHGRGGATPKQRDLLRKKGLSPRAWGSPRLAAGTNRQVRSIPTGVGEPYSTPRRPGMIRVYPHGRGGAQTRAHRQE